MNNDSIAGMPQIIPDEKFKNNLDLKAIPIQLYIKGNTDDKYLEPLKKSIDWRFNDLQRNYPHTPIVIYTTLSSNVELLVLRMIHEIKQQNTGKNIFVVAVLTTPLKKHLHSLSSHLEKSFKQYQETINAVHLVLPRIDASSQNISSPKNLQNAFLDSPDKRRVLNRISSCCCTIINKFIHLA